MPQFLSRPALNRVVQSLLKAEIDVLRGRRSTLVSDTALEEDQSLTFDRIDADGVALGCDSLEVLHLSAAVNEMFHLYEVGLESSLLSNQTIAAWLDIIGHAWERGVDRITLTTSGSSGSPKRCTHTFRHLRVEVDYLAELFQSRSRIVALAPAKHIYGLLFTALLPDRLNVPVLDLSSPFSATANQPVRTFRTGDLVVSVPNVWLWLSRSISHWEHDVEGVTSTAPCSRSILNSLSIKGLSRIVEIYGATETAGIGARLWPALSFSLMPHWIRYQEAADIPLKLISERSDLEISPMDELEFVDERCFLVKGRRDGAVQVGGTNVFLTKVEQRLSGFPGVASATVRLMRPDEGDRLKCFIVPDGDSKPEHLRRRLEAFIDSWLTPADRPKFITFGSELPRNVQGKLSDW